MSSRHITGLGGLYCFIKNPSRSSPAKRPCCSHRIAAREAVIMRIATRVSLRRPCDRRLHDASSVALLHPQAQLYRNARGHVEGMAGRRRPRMRGRAASAFWRQRHVIVGMQDVRGTDASSLRNTASAMAPALLPDRQAASPVGSSPAAPARKRFARRRRQGSAATFFAISAPHKTARARAAVSPAPQRLNRGDTLLLGCLAPRMRAKPEWRAEFGQRCPPFVGFLEHPHRWLNETTRPNTTHD